MKSVMESVNIPMKKWTQTYVSLLCLLTVCGISDRPVRAQAVPKSVRLVYLVSNDRPVREDFRRAIEHAAKDVQAWFARQLDGPTFKLNDPVVEVVKSDKSADWFYSHRNGAPDEWGFNNGLAEASRLIGAKHMDPKYVWVIYSDGPGNKGRGGSGVTVLPEDDLLGLVGRHPTQPDIQRWIGGLGHELGHAFGLPHPQDTDKDGDALMWAGFYGKYPNPTYLTPEDKRILRRSRFFFTPDGQPVAKPPVAVETYSYAGGRFVSYLREGTTEWAESKTDESAEFTFQEKSRDKSWIYLFDTSRNMMLRLPLAGGACFWSTDAGSSWHQLYFVNKSP